jgi:hypothetical protein
MDEVEFTEWSKSAIDILSEVTNRDIIEEFAPDRALKYKELK